MRLHSRMGALSLALLMLLTACATPTGGEFVAGGHRPPTSQAPGGQGEPGEADTESSGEEETVFARLPTDFAPVRVGDSEFKAALATLVLHMPLRVAPYRPPLYVGRRLALASAPLSGETSSDIARAYGRFCKQRGSPGDCLTLLEDGPLLRDDDKRSLALALAVGPAMDGLDAEVRAMIDPTRVLATLSLTIAGYMALLLAPEPVTKGVAAAFTVLMWGYLGWEFLDLLRAYARLYEDAPRASTFAELREIGTRFGRVIGPNSVRILILVGTAAIGETAALVSKGPTPPGFGQVARTVEPNTGLPLWETASGAERVIVSVTEGTIRVVLPAQAVSMTARNGVRFNGHRAFKSFRAFKRFMGKAGEGKQWHHIVEKHMANLKRFGAEALHNTENVIPINEETHKRISAFYSSIQKFSEGMTVREWISLQSYEAQRAFGLQVLRDYGVIP